MKKVSILVACILAAFPTLALAQTIIVDPETYEIRIIDDNSEPSIQEAPVEEVVNPIEEVEFVPPVDTTANQVNTAVTETSIKSPSISEFEQALAWMYQNQMTIFNNADSYEPFNQLTRAQFAKMINRFSLVAWYNRNTVNDRCDFVDLGDADPTLEPHIIETCKVGIFKGYEDYTFRPNKKLTKAEALTVILRIYNGNRLDESTNPRRQAYYDQAKSLGITSEQNPDNVEQVINRYLIALYMYRLHQKMDTSSAPVVVEQESSSIISTVVDEYPAIVKITKRWDQIIKIMITSETQNITLDYDDITDSFVQQ